MDLPRDNAPTLRFGGAHPGWPELSWSYLEHSQLLFPLGSCGFYGFICVPVCSRPHNQRIRLKCRLRGEDPGLGGSVPRAAPTVSETSIQAYLRATAYFRENPDNLPNVIRCAQKGATLLPPPLVA